MVRTRSGIEVRVTQIHDNEDDIVIEDEAGGDDFGEESAREDAIDDDGQSQQNMYNVIVFYGGHFVHVPYFAYTSNMKKVYKNIDFENLSINELKSCFDAVVGEFDSLYYKTAEGKIHLVNSESKPKLVEMSESKKIVLYVYHLSPAADSDIERDEMDGYNCSDDEYVEIRKACREEKKKMDDLERQANLDEVNEMDFDDTSESDKAYYPSSEESDEEFCYATPPAEKQKIKHVGAVFNVHTPDKDIKFKAGMIFSNKKEIKQAVRSSSMANGRPYQYLHDDLKRVQVGCAHGCPFKMWLSYNTEKDVWQLKSIVDEHNCVWNYKNKLVSTKYLVDLFGDNIRKNPNWKLGEMQEEFKRVLKVDVCEAKCSRVRKQALGGVEDKMREHYAKIRKFGGEILKSNRQNTVKISTTREQEGDVNRFRRIYICYAALKSGWKECCRPVLGLDGCFLKTVTGGQLLSAVGRDANNSIYPVAMAVVESENYESWKWFLEQLVDDLDLEDGHRKTIISDQQKGLDKAIRELLPQVEHRFCTRHLSANLKKQHPSNIVRNAFWGASTATHPQAFKKAMKELAHASKGAFEKMSELDPGMWSKAYFQTYSLTDSTENNISECFNSWILKARYMPLIDMLIEIHDMLMTRIHQKRDRMAVQDIVIVPKAKAVLDEAIKFSCGLTVLWDGRDTYVVKGNGTSCSVNLQNRTCSCRVWDLTGIPCCHGVTAIQEARKNPVDFVDKCYSKETYMKTYSHCLDVIKGEDFWEDVEGDLILPPLMMKKLRGRPKKMRRREGWEGVVSSGKKTRISYEGRVMHCGLCRAVGHRRDKCPDKDKFPMQGQKTRGKKIKNQPTTEPVEEVNAEVEMQAQEHQTGEDELMNETLADMQNEELQTGEDEFMSEILTQMEVAQSLDEVAASIEQPRPSTSMKFMPTPSLRTRSKTGCTPPASTPPTMSQKAKKKTPRKSVKPFSPPRPKKL